MILRNDTQRKKTFPPVTTTTKKSAFHSKEVACYYGPVQVSFILYKRKSQYSEHPGQGFYLFLL